MEAKAFGLLQRAVLCMLVAAVLGGMLLPVYSDEVGWRFQERAAFDGVDKLYSDVCGPNTLAKPPVFMMPVRYYSAFFNSIFADPFYVRLSGVIYALGWLAMVAVLLRRLADGPAARARLATVGMGLMCLGTLPLLIVWSRPEQPLILATTAAILIATSDWREREKITDASIAWRRSIAVLLLALIATSYHLKGVFLVPAFLACIWLASRGRAARLPRGAASVVLLAAAMVAGMYWVDRLSCPGNAIVRMEFADNNTGALLVGVRQLGDLPPIVFKLIANMNPLLYAGLAAPRIDPLSEWLPAGQIAKSASFKWYQALLLAWGFAGICSVAALATAATQCWRQRTVDPRVVIAFMLLITVLGWSATQQIRNVYEAIFVLPLAMLGIVLSLATIRPDTRTDKFTNVLALLIGVGALLSPPLIAGIYGPSLLRASHQRGYVDGQRYSVAHFGYAAVKEDILGAARLCGITDPARARSLMVDDLTYFSMMKSWRPQHWIGVLPRRNVIPDPIGYLKSRQSDGLVMGCHMLPKRLQLRARRQGQFCCMGPPNW